jgi:hypothetical protein
MVGDAGTLALSKTLKTPLANTLNFIIFPAPA